MAKKKGGAVSGEQFRARVEAAYAKHNPDSKSEHGALAWYARLAGVVPRAAWVWTTKKSVRRANVRMLQVAEAMPSGTPWINNPEELP